MNKINNIRLATAALVAVFVCNLASTSISAAEKPAYDDSLPAPSLAISLNVNGLDVKFDKNNPKECFDVFEKVCNGPKDIRHRSYLFLIARRALGYDKDKVLEMIIKFAPTNSDIENFGGVDFLNILDDKDRVGFCLDLGYERLAIRAIKEVASSRMQPNIFGSGIIESANPKTQEGQKLKADLLEYYRLENLLKYY